MARGLRIILGTLNISEHHHGEEKAAVNVQSWHNWHINKDGELQRLSVTSDITIEKEIFVCGCKYGETDAGLQAAADPIMPAYRFGIFMLPHTNTNEVPKAAKDKLEANYEQTTIKIDYVPRKGKRCNDPDFVC